MPELPNDTGALRLALSLVARDGPSGRILATVAIEYLDRRDGEWWPVVRLPPLYLEGQAVERLLGGATDLLRGSTAGFAWRPSEASPVGLQFGTVPGGATVEVGVDLGHFLADVAGVALRADAELALFRWRVQQGDLVRFSDALTSELRALPT